MCCGLLESLYTTLAFVFNSLQPLVPKTGGGYTPEKLPFGISTLQPLFPGSVCKEVTPPSTSVSTRRLSRVLGSSIPDSGPSLPGNTVPLLLQCWHCNV